MKTKVLVVAGPTASGKTGLGIALARRLDGEIVCADSMQIYTGMPIATAAPTAAERQAAVHHLAEILPPDTPFSVAQYCKLAAETVANIAARGKVPILVGGTGLFIDSFIDHIQFAHVQTNPDLRRELLAKDGTELYRTLQQVDPTAAAEIHPNNKNRVVRALELYYAGITKTAPAGRTALMRHCILCSTTGIGRCCMIESMLGWTPCWPPDWWRKHGRPTPLAVLRHGRPLGTRNCCRI